MAISLKKLAERNAAFDGVRMSLRQRLATMAELYDTAVRLSPFKQRSFVKSFRTFREYHAWKKAQKNPWYW